MLIKDIVRTFTNAYKDNGGIDDLASLTWELVEYFVNGLDCLVSCPKFLLHLEPQIATVFFAAENWKTWRTRNSRMEGHLLQSQILSQNTQKAEKIQETREYPEN